MLNCEIQALYAFTCKQGGEMHCETTHCSLPQILIRLGALPWGRESLCEGSYELAEGKGGVPRCLLTLGWLHSKYGLQALCSVMKLFPSLYVQAGFLQKVLPSLWFLLSQWEGLCLLLIQLYGLKE